MTPTTDKFLQRPDYSFYQTVDIKTLRAKADSLSKQGSYDIASLWAFRKLWLRSKKPADYLAYLVFRRALGYLLTPLKAETLKALTGAPKRWFVGFYGHSWRQVQQLLAEYYFHMQQVLTTAGIRSADRKLIQYWRGCQSQWQQQLMHYLSTVSRVQLVGNSPKLRSSGMGDYIDKAGCVVRFNHFLTEQSHAEDTGIKCDIWVIAPGFRSPFVPDCDWVLLTGPNMLWWQQNWTQLKPLSEKKLISIPLVHWRYLVRRFAAPPSAGLLTLQYLSELSVEKSTLQLAGFGYNPASEQDYHLALPQHKAVSRHNWQAEYQYLQRWSDKEGQL